MLFFYARKITYLGGMFTYVLRRTVGRIKSEPFHRQLDSNMCPLCGNVLLVRAGEEGIVENTYRLTCGHE